VRRIFISALLACPALAEFSAAQNNPAPSPFDPKPMVLAPDSPPELPMPEKFWGEPLPAPEQKAFLVEKALQLAPQPDTAPDDAAHRAKVMQLFLAVADGNHRETLALLDEGVGVDSTLPLPADPAFAERFRGSHLHYFITVEPGLTPLMLAAGAGRADMVQLLLDAGASPGARTKRHRTFPLWMAGKGKHTEAMQVLLGVKPDSEAARLLVEVDLEKQTATILRDGVPDESAPVSTGRKKFRTPPGDYVVTDKHRKWGSTLYPADMPYFMRLSCGEIGFHQGNLPGYPASHGCIRMRRKDAAEFFKRIPVGTKVVIK